MIVETNTCHCRCCQSEQIIKNGKNAFGNQQYPCKACGASRVLDPKVAYTEQQQAVILNAYQERFSMRGIERTFGVSRHTHHQSVKEKTVMRKSFVFAGVVICSTAILSTAWAQSANQTEQRVPILGQNPVLLNADQDTPTPGVSPARRINRQPSNDRNRPPLNTSFRSIDGSGNNPNDSTLGAAHTPLTRILPSAYFDGVETLAGENRPSARAISQAVNAQDHSIPNTVGASDFLWQWGQFLDHDIDLTDGTDPPEPADILVPIGDPYFDPSSTGTAVISFNRSLYDPASGTGIDNPRQQLNEITTWIDASNVYGSDSERAEALRTLDGSGRLRTSTGNLLPFNRAGLPNAGGDSDELFLAGDVRANEQVGLSAMHTLFVREHNRQAARIAEWNPNFSGNQIYEQARRIVGAQMQVITYQEYLPTLLGLRALAPYEGYRPEVDASISNLFSTASYRYGHSALSPTLLRVDAAGNKIAEGHLALRDAFFSPQRITDEGGIDPILRGLASQLCQQIDPYVVDDVRNFLFGLPGADGFDLVALNIQRGRDHGLPSYNDAREALGLSRAQSFAEVSSNSVIQGRLAEAYNHVDDIDIWVGGLAEDRLANAMVGELIFTVLKEQFEALRDGDRFWYRLIFDQETIAALENTRLADIIRRNTRIDQEIPDNVFRLEPILFDAILASMKKFLIMFFGLLAYRF